MRTHRVFVAAALSGLLGIVPVARAQRATEPDPIAWDVIDEDCGALREGASAVSEGRSEAPREIEPAAPDPSRTTPPRRRSRTSASAEPSPEEASPHVASARAAVDARPRSQEPSASVMASVEPAADRTPRPDSSHDGTLPRGRAVGRLTPAACEAVLRAEGVPFERVSSETATSAIAQPVRLGGPLRGVAIRPHGGDEASIHSIIDCRLAVALLGWADAVRAAGFVAIEHVSIFRPGARVARTHRPSGHSHALALDALRFVRADGTFFSVLDDWAARVRGTDPCATYEETEASASVRRLVCGAVLSETFQVVVTPHHDDAHANHVHIEIVPGVDWTVAR